MPKRKKPRNQEIRRRFRISPRQNESLRQARTEGRIYGSCDSSRVRSTTKLVTRGLLMHHEDKTFDHTGGVIHKGFYTLTPEGLAYLLKVDARLASSETKKSPQVPQGITKKEPLAYK